MRYPDPDKFEGKVQTIDPEVFAVFVPIIQGNGNVCIGQLLTYKSTPNEPGFTYEWSSKGKGVLSGPAGQINAVYEWKASGTDTLTLKKTNVTTGCTKDTSIIVTINPLPIPIINQEYVEP